MNNDIIDENAGQYDFIIAGGGAAGCVLANRLSKNPKHRVLLLEAGIKQNWIWTKIPMGYIYSINNPRTDWCYKTEPEPGLNGRSIIYARGKGLGGCTLINAMLYLRGQSSDYNHWADLTQDTNWSWQQVLPRFKKSEHYWQGSSEYHGAKGEWQVNQARVHWNILDQFANACAQTNIPRTDDFNTGNNLGVSTFEVNQKNGLRWSAYDGFVKPIRQRSNLTIMTEAMIDKVLFDPSKRATAIRFSIADKPFTAHASKEIILSAGSIGSPNILERSGIGDQQHLASLGIPLVHHQPAVGENLQDHLQLRLIYKVQNAHTLNKQVYSLVGKLKMAAEYLFLRKGPLTMAPSQLGAFAFSDETVSSPDLEYHIQPLSLEKFGDPLHRFSAITVSVCNLRPHSRGSIHIKSADKDVVPAIKPHYLSDPRDQETAVKAIKLTRKIMGQPAMQAYSPDEYLPGSHIADDIEIMKSAGDIGTTIFHPVGTCKMGHTDDPNAVVDSRLRVIGVAGLRVVDASIMPTITSGNTSSPTVMIAERGAEVILEDHSETR